MKNLSKYNIAIVHDIFAAYGGAEQVAIELIKLFPNANIYTSWFDRSNPLYERVKHRIKGRISPYNPLNIIKNKNFLKLILYSYWEQFDFNSYDIVISSSHSFSSKAIITSPNTLHIDYCHTPPKYLYAEESGSQIRKSKSLFPHIALTNIRTLDYIAAQRPDYIIANSKIVSARIRKYYGRASTVIYPPVDVPNIFRQHSKKPYFIYVGRLTKSKGVECIIRACNTLKKKLIIVGDGDNRSYLQSLAGPTIDFKGFLSIEKKNTLIQHASAFLFAGVDEDFGIAPVESMGWGTPVIAYRSGALTETVIDGKTGLLFNIHSTEALIDTIQKFEHMKFSQKECYQQAKKFSTHLFRNNIVSFIKKSYEKNASL